MRPEDDTRYDSICNWIKVQSTSVTFQPDKCLLYNFLCTCENKHLHKKLLECLPQTKGTDLVINFSKNFVLWEFLISCEERKYKEQQNFISIVL